MLPAAEVKEIPEAVSEVIVTVEAPTTI